MQIKVPISLYEWDKKHFSEIHSLIVTKSKSNIFKRIEKLQESTYLQIALPQKCINPQPAELLKGKINLIYWQFNYHRRNNLKFEIKLFESLWTALQKSSNNLHCQLIYSYKSCHSYDIGNSAIFFCRIRDSSRIANLVTNILNLNHSTT